MYKIIVVLIFVLFIANVGFVAWDCSNLTGGC